MRSVEPRATAVIKPSRTKKLRNGYPWVLRDEVVEVVGKVEPGELVAVVSPDQPAVGIGFWNPVSRFAVRMLDLQASSISQEFFAAKFARARARRVGLLVIGGAPGHDTSRAPRGNVNLGDHDATRAQRDNVTSGERQAENSVEPVMYRAPASSTNSYRVAFAEADGLPGLIVDRYADWLIVQVRSAGMHHYRDLWLPALIQAEKPKGILERSDMEGLAEEGLEPSVKVLFGEVPDEIEVIENGLTFICPTRTGLKTGFYLDQRDARRKLSELVTPGETVLDACCYSGGFTLFAARSGAIATGLDILPEAIELAKRNGQNIQGAEFICANVFEWLAETKENFDTILLDPPAIAKTGDERDSLKGAIHKLTTLALPRLVFGGRLVVFSCSYQLGVEALLEVVRSAINDQGRRCFVEDITLQPPDHPYLAQFPESLYLKGIWLRVE
ncbi:MAG: class I SAM-dependent rRNA methyltransferase [Fimbriimonadaceae bacterium]